jgi:hypothetical protein
MTPIISPKPSESATWEQWRDWCVLQLARKVVDGDEFRHITYLYSAKWPSSPAELQEAERYRHAHAQLVSDKIRAAKGGR